MTESKTMKQIHSIREKNYYRTKGLSVKERIKTIRDAAEPVKKSLLEKMKKRETPASGR